MAKKFIDQASLPTEGTHKDHLPQVVKRPDNDVPPTEPNHKAKIEHWGDPHEEKPDL